jgi:hypothetical protein
VLFVVGGTCRSPKISKSTSWQTLKIPICLPMRAMKGSERAELNFGALMSFWQVNSCGDLAEI